MTKTQALTTKMADVTNQKRGESAVVTVSPYFLGIDAPVGTATDRAVWED